jgi:hypothetical protein
MELTGLPDFQQPIPGDDGVLYPRFGAEGYALAPRRLEFAARDDGRPDFLLELVRGTAPDLPPAPHALLDFRVRPAAAVEAALALLRLGQPAAQVRPAELGAGWLRLSFAEALTAPPAHTAPVALGPGGLDIARALVQVTATDGAMLKGGLLAGTLAFSATAELELAGVAPRLPLAASFDPAALLAALLPLADPQRLLPRAAVEAFFRDGAPAGLLAFAGDRDGADQRLLAAALADRLAERFAAPHPAPGPAVEPFLQLADPAGVAPGRFRWDLAEPAAARRVAVLELDRLAAARALLGADGPLATCRETVVEPLQSGFLPVLVDANLPAHREGLLAAGVTLTAAANPPLRPQAVVHTLMLRAPEDRARAVLRLSPLEAPAYTCRTFVMLRGSAGVQRIEGPERRHTGGRVQLTPADFAAPLLPVAADRDLLALADIAGRLSWTSGADGGEVAFTLTAAAPAVALALPPGAEGAISVEARPRVGAARRLGPLPARALRLGLYSFPEFGPHAVEVRCAFRGTAQLLAIELQAEDDPPGRVRGTLFLSPDAPRKPWSWLARSPFQPGFRYRPAVAPGEAPEPWSAVQPHDAPLSLEAGGEPDEKGDPMRGADNVFEGITYGQDPADPLSFSYLPGSPGPQRGADGAPSVSCLVAGPMTMLQVGAEWGASEAQLGRLRRHLGRERGLDPERIKLHPAPVRVERVELRLADAAGAAQTLASSESSGYPPFSAIFSVQLDEAQKAQALAALGGRAGLLTVAYITAGPGGQPLELATDVASWFGGGSGMDHVQIVGG